MTLRRHLPAYRQLDQLVNEGRAQMIATPTADTGTIPTIVATQADEVAIITRIFGTALPSNDTSPGLGDAGATHGIQLYDENGDATLERWFWISHQRVDAAFWSPSAPEFSWQSAPPNAPIDFEMEEPIIIPPRHTLRMDALGPQTMAGGSVACYGYIVDVATARMLGFSTGSQDTTTKPEASGVITSLPSNTGGFRGGAIVGVDLATVVPALAGHTVQIIDMHIRMQPMTGGSSTVTANVVAATGSGDALSSTDVVFAPVNNNHGDLAEWKMSPCLYLQPDHGLFLISLGGARVSCNVTYRYVQNSEVPQGMWWSYAAITPPGANTNTTGTSSLFTDGSQEMTLIYPGKIAAGYSTTTATSAGTGYQHVLEGWAVAAQKDATIPGDRLYFAITDGAAAGNIGLSGSGLTTTNKLCTPIMCLGGHNQNMALALDGLNIPGTKDTGSFRVEMTGRGSASATPLTNDLDVDEMHVLIWGRTIPATYGTSHFKGGAS